MGLSVNQQAVMFAAKRQHHLRVRNRSRGVRARGEGHLHDSHAQCVSDGSLDLLMNIVVRNTIIVCDMNIYAIFDYFCHCSLLISIFS